MPSGIYKRKPRTERHCENISKSLKNNEKVMKHMTEMGKANKDCIPWNIGLTKEIDLRVEKISENSKNNKEHIEQVTELGKSNKDRKRTEESKEKYSKAKIKQWQDSDWRKMIIEVRKGISKKLWQDPEFVKKQMKARNVRPNKIELIFNNFLQQILPKEYKYVGDGEFILAGKCPDFVNINGRKKIIELFGNYWHKDDDGKERIELFKQYGYQTLIIWENELENKKELKEKLLFFNRGIK